MNNILEYKGYYTKVEYSAEDNILHGKIEAINDLVTFECDNVADIEKEFHCAVDDYLIFCEENGIEPDKTYSGVFNVRISPELHRQAMIEAGKMGLKLNAFVKKAIQEKVEGTAKAEYHIYFHLQNGRRYDLCESLTENRRIKYAGC